jgi:exopolysaccharide biosynthesis protein
MEVFPLSILRKTNRHWRYFIGCLLCFCLALSFNAQQAQAEEPPYYEQRYEEPVAQGLSYVRKTRFTPSGWQNIHVLKADLHNSNLVVDSLLSSKGLSNPEPLSQIAKKARAVAGINGDFFYLGQTNAPLGVMVKDGQLLSSPFWSQEMSVFALTENLKAILGNWNWQGEIINEDGVRMPLGGTNKTVSNYEQTVIYDSNWGSKLGNYDFSLAKTAVLTIKDGLVVASDLNPAEILIPEQGSILVAQGETADQLTATFPLGSRIEIEQSSSPELSKIKMAIGGGANLVYNGEIPSFTHNIAGKHQRTALGITKDNRYLFLVAVDGRDGRYQGMTQEELAKFMQSIGCYYAINLDGGGSSTLVARPLGEDEIEVKNNLVGGQERSIPNGIGIFSTSPVGQLAGLKIETSDHNVPLWGIREFKVKGYDQYLNPVPVNPETVKWSVSNNLGRFEGSLLGTGRPGKGIVTAQVGEIKATLSIRVIDRAEQVKIEPETLNLSPGAKQQLTFTVIDQNGFRAELSPLQISPELTGNVGKMEGNTFIAGTNPGTGMLKIKYDQAEGYCSIAVGQDQKIIEDFENPSNLYFSSYPEEVEGSYEQSDLAHSGSGAAKLKFSFVPIEKTQAAYLMFGSQGMSLPANSRKIGVWVYNDGPNGHWLRAQVSSKDGSSKDNLDLAREVNWQGWKYVEANLPGNGEYVLDRIYLVETDSLKMNQGEIYLDDLTVTLPLTAEQLALPTRTDKNLTNHKLSKPQQGGFLFSTTVSPEDSTLDYSGRNFSLALSGEGVLVKKEDGATVDKSQLGKKYGSFSYQNSHFVLLDTTKGGMRASDKDQWNWLMKEIDRGGLDNLFLISPTPLNKISDEHEAELLLELLAKAKEKHNQEVWVISSGTGYSWAKRDGVHLVYLPEKELKNGDFLVKGKTITYNLQKNE